MYKSIVFVKGFQQIEGANYTKTCSLVVKANTIRLVLSLSISQNWKIMQLDVNVTFLNGDINEEVYMAQLGGFEDPRFPNHICKLKKAIYDLI